MRLEAINTMQIETVLAMIRARTHLIDRYMAGTLHRDDNVDERNPDGMRNAGTTDADIVFDE